MNAVLAIGNLIFELRQSLQTVVLHRNTFFLFGNKSYFSFLLSIKMEITLCVFISQSLCGVCGKLRSGKKKPHTNPKYVNMINFGG